MCSKLLLVGAEMGLLDGKGLIKKECLQSTFKSNDSVTIADIEWYRAGGSYSYVNTETFALFVFSVNKTARWAYSK